MFRKADLSEYTFDPFKEIGENWSLVTAKKDGKVNTMTVSWGSAGILWRKKIITVYIREGRCTREFMDADDHFTLSLFDGHKDELMVLGTKSGRDCDKIAEVGFDVEMVEGQPTFSQAKAVLVLKKIFKGDLPVGWMDPELKETIYTDIDHHCMYIGEIESFYIND